MTSGRADRGHRGRAATAAGSPGPARSAGRATWARRMYARSLLALRALTDRRTGAVAAGARDGWAYVWPRDAATAALALAAAGYRPEARRVVALPRSASTSNAAARFDGDGAPVPGRAAQGDAAGWVAAAARATGLPPPGPAARSGAIAPTTRRNPRATTSPTRSLPAAESQPAANWTGGLDRARPGLGARLGGGLGGAAISAARPLPARPHRAATSRPTAGASASPPPRTGRTRLPGRRRRPGAPGAWLPSASAVRRCACSPTCTGPRRRPGCCPSASAPAPACRRSTTPLAWSHAFAILAIRQLWPGRRPAPARPARRGSRRHARHMLGGWKSGRRRSRTARRSPAA